MKSLGRVVLADTCAKRTQRQIARETGISKSTINDHIAGRTERSVPRLRHALIYRDKLGIAVDAWIHPAPDDRGVAKSENADAGPAIRSEMNDSQIADAIEPLVSKLRSKDQRVVADTKEQIRALLEQLPDAQTGDDAGREPWPGAGRQGTDGWQNQRDGGPEPQPRTGPTTALASMGRPRPAPRTGFGFSRDEGGQLHSPRATDRTPGRGR